MGGVGLVKGRVRGAGKAMVAVCEELEQNLEKSGWFSVAPFSGVSHVLRFGLEPGNAPELGRIERSGYLQTATQVSMDQYRRLAGAPSELRFAMRAEIIATLLAVAAKYKLPNDWLLGLDSRAESSQH